jgi:gliding motility-associated-like protein
MKFLCLKVCLLLLLIAFSKNVKSANYYWRALAVDNLFTNVGNWETTQGGGVNPSVAPSSNDSVFFPVTSNITSVNINGGNCGVFTVSSPTTFTYTGTGNFYGDINANGNVLFNNTNVTFQGPGVKNINVDTNPLTAVYYFTGGSILCNSGTVNLNHNLLTTSTLNLTSTLTQFNSNSFDINCGNLRIGNAVTGVYDLTNSKIRTSNITYYTTNQPNLITNGVRLELSKTVGNVFYSYGSAPVSFQSVTVEGSGAIDWYSNNIIVKMDSLVINQASSFSLDRLASCTIDSVLIIKKATTFKGFSNLNLSLNRIETPSVCYGQSTMKNFSLTTISPITINTISFNTVNFLGAGLTTSVTNNVVNNSGAGITWTGPLVGNVFHWVGDDGDWNDPTEWSLLGSGGAAQLPTGCVPTYADSVVFDNNSFSIVGQVVNTVALQAKCKSINNIDVNNEGVFNGFISIGGNANFTGASAVNSIELVGGGNHSLASGSNFTYSGIIIFDAEGDYTLLDSIVSVNTLDHRSGGLDFDGNNIDVNSFLSEGKSRTLDFSNSVIRTKTGTRMTTRDLFFLDAANSTIILENPSALMWFGGGAPSLPMILNDVYFTETTGIGNIYTNNIDVRFNDVYFSSSAIASYGGYTANTLNLTAGKIYSFLPRAGGRFTILSGINTTITSCNDLAVLKSTTGTQVDLYKASLPFTTNGLITQGINATGVSLTVNNGVDLGNNNNVIIAPGIGRDMYWVNDGGNWDDGIGHWSIGVSGGNPAVTNPTGCIPRPIDNVFFDVNSFTLTGQTVALNIDANCNDITWDVNAASFNPIFSGANTINLDIYGSLKFSTGMVHSHSGRINFRGTLTGVNSQTIHADNVSLIADLYFEGGGRYDIINDLSGTAACVMYFNSGHLYTNSHSISIGGMFMNYLASNSADISNSNIILSWYRGYNAEHYATNNFTANNSLIQASSVTVNVRSAFVDTIKYCNIVANTNVVNTRIQSSPLSFNNVTLLGNSNLRGTFIIDSLIYAQSTVNTLNPSGFYYVLDTLVAYGTPCVPITLRSSSINVPVNIMSDRCNFDIQFGNIQDLMADISSGCTAVDYKVFGNDAGGNLNWNFVSPSSVNQLGIDTLIYCTNTPYVLSTDAFGNSPASYLWNTGETTKNIEIKTSGKYYVRVAYSVGCIASDTVNITVLDTVAPVLVCPNDSVVFLDNNCQYILPDFTSSIAIDDCTPDSAIVLTQTPLIGTLYSGESIQTIWIYAEDIYGNIDSCSFQLTLSDTINPIIGCNDTTVYLSSLGTYTIDTSYIFNNVIDNCGVDSIWMLGGNYTCVNIGINTVTLYVKDISNNVDSCIAIVNVLDTVTPVISCNDTIVYLSQSGAYIIDTSYIFGNASSGCGIASIWTNDTLYTCNNIGTNTATLYVLDLNGNLDSCISTITVVDTLHPIVACKDTTIYLNASGQITIDTSFVFRNVIDNCGVDSIWTNDTLFTCVNTGINIATIYARDVNGNVDSCVANVSVLDTIIPTVVCIDTTIYLPLSGRIVIDTSFVHLSNSDNCAIDSVWIVDSLFTCVNEGLNTVLVYVRDINNNITSCSANVTIVTIIKRDTLIEDICDNGSYIFGGVSYNQDGYYSDTLVSNFGCDSIVTLNLIVYPVKNSTVFDTICEGSTYGFLGKQYSLAGKYNDTLNTYLGCDSIVELNLEVIPTLRDTLRANICYGETYVFGGDSLVLDGVYYDTLQSSLQCDSIVALYLGINTITRPYIIGDSIICNNTTSTLEVNDIYQSYFWNAGENTPQIEVYESGFYRIFVTDQDNCFSSDSIYLRVVNCEDTCQVYVPNSFSPNEDGVNDVFEVIIPETCGLTLYELRIFSRWGELLFTTDNQDKKWDGTYKNQKIKADSYVWMLEYQEKDHATNTFVTGTVTVIK